MLDNKISGGSGKKIKKILKHKNLIIASVLPFVFWGVLLTLWFYRAPQSIGSSSALISEQGGQVSISDLAKSVKALDDDNDGLSDWEESVYGTNPKNPDSDGDGYLDGEEIISGRDPLKKGPDDPLIKKQGALTKEEQGKETATKAFSKIALMNFFNSPAAKNLSSLTPEQLDAELKKSFKDNPEALKEFQKEMRDILYEFVPKDLDKKIKIIGSSQNKDEQDYTDAVAKVIKKTRSNNGMELGKLILDIFERKDFSKTDFAISYYNTLYNEFLAIPVPKTMLMIHRNAILLFYETAKGVELIRDWENDPVRSFVAIQKFAGWLEKIDEIDKKIETINSK